jgi:hypothetical protein
LRKCKQQIKIREKEGIIIMAKKPISEKKVTTTKLSLEGTLNLDELQGFVMEFEEEGEKNVVEKLKKYNGQYGTLTFTVKEEEDIED